MFGMLTHYGRPLPNNAKLGYSKYVSTREAAMNPGVEDFVRREARHAFADMISGSRITRHEHDHSIEFRCDVYVFNPDEFWQIVEEAAQEIASRYPTAEPKEIKP